MKMTGRGRESFSGEGVPHVVGRWPKTTPDPVRLRPCRANG
jgi:hypothetical protein